MLKSRLFVESMMFRDSKSYNKTWVLKKFRKLVSHVVTKTWCGSEASRDVLACAATLEMALRVAAGLVPLLRLELPVAVLNF